MSIIFLNPDGNIIYNFFDNKLINYWNYSILHSPSTYSSSIFEIYRNLFSGQYSCFETQECHGGDCAYFRDVPIYIFLKFSREYSWRSCFSRNQYPLSS